MPISVNGNTYPNNTITVNTVVTPNNVSLTPQQIQNPDIGTNPIYGPTGNGISNIVKTSTSGLTDTYTIYFTNGSTTTFDVKNGKGIVSITLTSTVGLVDTYTILFNDNTTQTFTVTNGEKGDTGETGATGNGIASIEKTAISELVDTYTITYTNGNTATFDVTNGQNGQDGDDGISPTAEVTPTLTGATITITDANGTTTANITNGSDAEVTAENITNALGYTPVNSDDLANVATTGDYYDLTNTPSIPTSADYWTVGTSGGSDSQTTYSKKLIYYKQSGAQDNGFRMLADSDTSTVGTTGAWSARCLIGNEKRTFLLGTAKNSASPSQSICGIGAHTWGSASSQTGAGWDNIYIQPDGSTATYIGGSGWRGNSGWFRVQNNGSGSASYRTEINTGSNTSPAWKKVLPNQATGTSAILFTTTIASTNSHAYSTSVNGTSSGQGCSSFGYGSNAANYATALGYNAKATGTSSIQIGQGTNSTANTMYVGLSSSLNVQLLDSTGKIPTERYASYDSTEEMLVL